LGKGLSEASREKTFLGGKGGSFSVPGGEDAGKKTVLSDSSRSGVERDEERMRGKRESIYGGGEEKHIREGQFLSKKKRDPNMRRKLPP